MGTVIHEGTIDLGATRIAYSLRRSQRRKTIGITIAADGMVEVVAPEGLSAERISRAVREKGEWIVRKQVEIRQFSKSTPREIVSGESIRYLGCQYLLKIVADDVSEVRLKFLAGHVQLRVSSDLPAKKRVAAAKEALQDWFRARLELIVAPIAERCANQIGEAVSEIRVRDLGHRWGSCGKSRVLYFNWRLAMAPKALIEFVVAHEVCHLRHPDHSKAFFRLLFRILPDWEIRQERLDREGTRFDL